MKKEVKLFLAKALESLVLSIEMFNRPSDSGRACAVLILLDHGFEMLMKAAILEKRGTIVETNGSTTIGFKTCVNRACNSGDLKFISDDEARLLRSINGLRDKMQHHLLLVSEHLLYLQVQSGVTLFRDLLKRVFNQDLAQYLPYRVLPISSTVPIDLVAIFLNELNEIHALLGPGKRRRAEAHARLEALAIVENSLMAVENPPSTSQMAELERSIKAGRTLSQLFPGVATVETLNFERGLVIELRMTKRDGLPVHYVDDEQVSLPVAPERFGDTDYYCFSAPKLAEKLGLKQHETHAMIFHLHIQENLRAFKALAVYRTPVPRYSAEAVKLIRAALTDPATLPQALLEYKSRPKKSKANR